MVAWDDDASVGSSGLVSTPDSTLSSICAKLKQEQARQKTRLSSISSSPSKDLKSQKDFTKEAQNGESETIRQRRLQKAIDLDSLLAKAQSSAERLLRPEEDKNDARGGERSWELRSENSFGSILEELERQIDITAERPTTAAEALAATQKLEERLETAEMTMELLRSEGALAHEEKKAALAQVASLEARLEDKIRHIEDRNAVVEALEEKHRSIQSDMTRKDEANIEALAIVEDEKQQLKDKVHRLVKELTTQKELAIDASRNSATHELRVKELEHQVDELRIDAAEERKRSVEAAEANAKELKLLGETISQSALKEQALQESLNRLQEQLEASEFRVEQLHSNSEEKIVEIRTLRSQLEEKCSAIKELQAQVEKLSDKPATSPFSALQQVAFEAKVKSEVEAIFSNQAKELETLVSNLQQENDALKKEICVRPQPVDTQSQTDPVSTELLEAKVQAEVEARFSGQAKELEILVSNLQQENDALKKEICDRPQPVETQSQAALVASELERELNMLTSELEASKAAMQDSAKELAEAKSTKVALQKTLAIQKIVTLPRAPARTSAIASIEASIMVQRKKATFLLASGQSPHGITACQEKLQVLEQELALAKEQSSVSTSVNHQVSQRADDPLFVFNGDNLYTFDQLETALVETEKKVFEFKEAIATGDKYSEIQVAKVLQLSGRCIQALTMAKKDDIDSSTNDDSTRLRQELSEKETNALNLQRQIDALRDEMKCQGERLQNSKAELETLLEQSEQAKLAIARRDDDLREKEHIIKELTDQVENALACQQEVHDRKALIQEKEECLAREAREEREENSRRLAANEGKIKDFLRELEEARKHLLESSKLSEMIDSLRREITEKDKRIEAYEGKTNSLELAIDDLHNETRVLEDTVAACKKVDKDIEDELETSIKSSKKSEARAREIISLRHTIASQEEVLKTYKDHVAALEMKLVLTHGQGKISAESQEMQEKTSGNLPRRRHRSFVYVLNLSLASALMYFGTKKVLHKGHFQIDEQEQDSNVVVVEKASIDYAVLPLASPGAADESANDRAKVEKFQLMKTGLRQVATHVRRAAAHINANSYQKHIDESSFDVLNTAGNAVRGFIADELLNPTKIRAVVNDAAIAQAIAVDGRGPSSSAVSLSSPPSLPPWREIATSFVQATAQLGANLGSNNPMATAMYEAYLFENTAVHPFAFDILRSATPNNNNRTFGYNHHDSRNGNLTLTKGCHCDWN